jgi:hypothetical protein
VPVAVAPAAAVTKVVPAARDQLWNAKPEASFQARVLQLARLARRWVRLWLVLLLLLLLWRW